MARSELKTKVKGRLVHAAGALYPKKEKEYPAQTLDQKPRPNGAACESLGNRVPLSVQNTPILWDAVPRAGMRCPFSAVTEGVGSVLDREVYFPLSGHVGPGLHNLAFVPHPSRQWLRNRFFASGRLPKDVR